MKPCDKGCESQLKYQCQMDKTEFGRIDSKREILRAGTVCASESEKRRDSKTRCGADKMLRLMALFSNIESE